MKSNKFWMLVLIVAVFSLVGKIAAGVFFNSTGIVAIVPLIVFGIILYALIDYNKKRKEELEGIFPFSKAFKNVFVLALLGFVFSFISMMVFDLAINPKAMEERKEYQMEKTEEIAEKMFSMFGIDSEEADAEMEKMESASPVEFFYSPIKLFSALIGTAILAAFYSFITALFTHTSKHKIEAKLLDIDE